MIRYQAASGAEAGPLEHWPFDNPESCYRIIEGTPRASGRMDAGGPGHQTRAGIWRCTAGTFDCIEQGDEMMTVLSGRCRIINHTENCDVFLATGDSLYIRDGSHVTWVIFEDITKVFLGFKQDGY